MLLGLFRAASDCIRLILGILCCMFCSGPVCVVVGIVLFLTKGDREANINAYNAIVGNYTTGPIASWIPATVGANRFSLISQEVTVYGNLDDVLPATSRLLSAQGALSTTASYALTNVAPFTRSDILQWRWFFRRLLRQ